MDKISKLSQAIRLGATFRPQCRGDLFVDGGSCAIGAAYEALTGISTFDGYMELSAPSAERLLESRFNLEPNTCNDIAARNDKGHTREQIADWLAEQGL